ncbi:putative PiuB iron-regulated membrane protein [Vibrio nigripulchritudo SFn27]|uniref:Putative PiuB iron-regulated membrane protein n=1 Tax=Vibrio nigripulchritudo TaxID=28173 RepID=U4KIP5_9VIBR|nr:PepSY domain-containing protein [Vibrio nigripulchritudo]CCN81646.1 putative PiuB iron-regulated membrane protein [Vibrio nigripulchritudo BLFn1]CCN91743.1 putative PiuB iron-regulated membrane protein [Vibrio nigripulchritudo SFn27]CCN96627.1 putative PiuB iron-regulated membrane protein [Vibrio nigripulchritudo ENn2]CCO38501.1 putative PiuB iron-regulated membrane protein [Vibrio nigripulchritudo SFn135]CCO53958.1 putative PiuB iron-regulated membrane protein [Vibrio nigripulchritudo Wn13
MLGSTKTAQQKDFARSKNLYFLTWRWHFYAGLFVIPFMLILSLTGIVMLFDDELESARYGDMLIVEPKSNSIPVSQQLSIVESYAEGTVTQFVPAHSETVPNRFSVRFEDGSNRFVLVDPYTGDIKGEIDRGESWYALANDIHSTLLVGDTGGYLIEISASLSIILLVTGIYLWLPSDNASKAGFLKIRMQSGTRIFMRDLHANLGGVLSLVLLFFLVSGLAWAGIWGGKFVQPWSSFPAQKWSDVPLSDKTHASLNHGTEEEVPWGLEQTPLPESKGHEHHGGHGDHAHHINTATVSIDKVVDTASKLGMTQYKLNLPKSETGVFTLGANTMSGDITDPTQDRTTHIDQYSGEILADVTWEDYNWMAKFMAAGIALHTGEVSIINKLLNVFFCLAFVAVSVTGALMWWKRRPAGKKKLGAPPSFQKGGIWKLGAVTVVLVGFAFPLAGATIVTVLIVDALLLKAMPKLHHWFA